MSTYPWRFQADLKEGDTNPDVTVFVGDTITNNVTGESKVHQDTSNPEIVKLADLASYITTGLASGIVRTQKAPMPGTPPAAAPEAKAKK